MPGENDGGSKDEHDSGTGDSLRFPWDGRPDESLEGEDEADGLEPEERESEEIREIFGSTFPQYLQPVEEMVEQILSGKGDAETAEALLGMLASLAAASSRMGFDDIHKLLDRLHTLVSSLDRELRDPIPTDVREGILGDILELQDLTTRMAGENPAVPRERQQTIFSALKNKEGIGDLVLRRLGAAGLTTVDQLRMARPEEIAEVSGLDLKIVHNLLGLLSDSEDETAADMPEEVKSLHEQVIQKLRTEVEVEASLQDLKADTSRLRSRVSELRTQLHSVTISRREKKALASLSKQTAARAAFLDKLRAMRDAMARSCASREEEVHRREVRLEVLRRERRSVEKQAAGLNRKVGGLVNALGRIRRTVAKGRPVE